MPIPDYQMIMLPLLKFVADGNDHNIKEITDKLADEFGLTQEEKDKLLPSGQQPYFYNRVGWARTYLKKAGLVEVPKRALVRITERGKQILKRDIKQIDSDLLSEFTEFLEFKNSKKERVAESGGQSIDTPEEILENTYENLRMKLADDILDQVKSCPPRMFEKIVVEMLVAMGYGGTLKDAGRAVGKSGDEGIDGIIKEDRLGLDIIYIQAKRWANTVGKPEIQKFAGALQGQRARKGIFITTSDFTKEAIDYCAKIDTKIILLDGETLAQHMIDYNIGVAPVTSYELKRIDSDYFIEE